MISLILAALLTQPSAHFLASRAQEVTQEEIPKVQKIIEQMYHIARGERQDVSKTVMVGLAAPQIGIGKRIILVDLGVGSERMNLGTLTAYINPEIVWKSEEIEEGREGCFSVDRRIVGIVPRSRSIELIAWDRHGRPVHEKWDGFQARIFQHEVDHLNGLRFPDRVGPNGTLQWVEEEQYYEYRKNWKNWPHKCAWETWLKMKEK